MISTLERNLTNYNLSSPTQNLAKRLFDGIAVQSNVALHKTEISIMGH